MGAQISWVPLAQALVFSWLSLLSTSTSRSSLKNRVRWAVWVRCCFNKFFVFISTMMFYCYGMHYSVKSGNLYLSFNSFCFLQPTTQNESTAHTQKKTKNCFEPKKHKK